MDEEKKVYIVTSGEYSGYRVDCVFSTEDEAAAYTNRHNISRYDSYTWEEYIVDANTPVDRTGQIAFQVSYRDGYHPIIGHWACHGYADKTVLPFERVCHEGSRHMGTGGVSHRWETWVWAKDEQDALKIGADKIMPVLAEAQIEGVKAPEPEKPSPYEYMGAGTPFLKMMEKPESDFTIKVGKVEWGIRDGE